MAQQLITRADSGAAAAMAQAFSEAFQDDPGLSWLWPDRDDRIARLPRFFLPIVSGTIAHGIALHSSNSEAVSLWRLPGRIHPGPDEMVQWGDQLAEVFSVGGERSRLMGEALKAHQPVGFEWRYLQFIGVRPGAQGAGLGGAVLRSGLELAAAAGCPVYVEVMNPENLGYYRHAGFGVIDEFDIPDGGPHVWGMLWRKEGTQA